jgi:hypothetical protein
MTQGRRDRLSAEQRIDMWRRWKAGDSLHEIGAAPFCRNVRTPVDSLGLNKECESILATHDGDFPIAVGTPRRFRHHFTLDGDPWRRDSVSGAPSVFELVGRCGLCAIRDHYWIVMLIRRRFQAKVFRSPEKEKPDTRMADRAIQKIIVNGTTFEAVILVSSLTPWRVCQQSSFGHRCANVNSRQRGVNLLSVIERFDPTLNANIEGSRRFFAKLHLAIP